MFCVLISCFSFGVQDIECVVSRVWSRSGNTVSYPLGHNFLGVEEVKSRG